MANSSTVFCRPTIKTLLAIVVLSYASLISTTDTLAEFIDVTPAILVDQASSGVVWFDYDDDGDPDLLLTRSPGPKLLRNDGGDLFVDVTVAPLVGAGPGPGAICGDYDNDGDLDFYLANQSFPGRLFQNVGGSFIDASGFPLNLSIKARPVAWVEIDNDGDLDLIIGHNDGANRLFRNDEGAFIEIPFVASGQITESFADADFDNDGDTDLLVTNFSDATYLLRNDAGSFVAVPTPVVNPARSRGSDWGDFDNDGDYDIFLAGTARLWILRNDGASRFVDVTPLVYTFIGGYGAAFVDYDNDGDLDITSAQPSTIFLIRNDPGGFANPDITLPNSGTDFAWSDYDGDGDQDIFVTNMHRLWRNDLSNGNHWVHFDLEGVVSNRSGIGARVELVANGVTQIRQVKGTAGYVGQASLTVEFGLGDAMEIESLVVRWPSGIVQPVTPPAVDTRTTIVEMGAVSAPGIPGTRSSLWLAPPVPNPVARTTLFAFALPSPGSATLSIYDVRGRLVRRLEQGTMDAGTHSIQWDGRDERRQGVRAGVYFAHLKWTGARAQTLTEVQKLTVVR